jgi:hypothetical protein
MEKCAANTELLAARNIRANKLFFMIEFSCPENCTPLAKVDLQDIMEVSALIQGEAGG